MSSSLRRIPATSDANNSGSKHIVITQDINSQPSEAPQIPDWSRGAGILAIGDDWKSLCQGGRSRTMMKASLDVLSTAYSYVFVTLCQSRVKESLEAPFGL